MSLGWKSFTVGTLSALALLSQASVAFAGCWETCMGRCGGQCVRTYGSGGSQLDACMSGCNFACTDSCTRPPHEV